MTSDSMAQSCSWRKALPVRGRRQYGIALVEAAGANIAGVGHARSNNGTQEEVEKWGRRSLSILAALGVTHSLPLIVEKTIRIFGRIDILVNNAGIIRKEDAINFTEKDWDDVMNVNAKSLFFLSLAVAKQFLAQKSGGKIVNIASLLSFLGGIRIPSYTASKSAVMGLINLMANEWAKYNINDNAIAPGYMITSNTEAFRNVLSGRKKYSQGSRWPLGDARRFCGVRPYFSPPQQAIT